MVLLFFLLKQVYLTKLIKNITSRKTFNAIASLSIEVDSQSDEWVKTNVKLQLGMVGREIHFSARMSLAAARVQVARMAGKNKTPSGLICPRLPAAVAGVVVVVAAGRG